jgi:hypothetical protein
MNIEHRERIPPWTMGRRNVVLMGVLAAVLFGGTAVAVRLLSGDSSATPHVTDAPLEWTGPVRQERPNAGVETMETAEDKSLTWSEASDTAPGWVDVVRVGILPEFQNWRLDLGLHHPRRDALSRADHVLGFGFVMDTTGDGVANYVVGIDSDADAPLVRVWLTDLATGETEENSTGPYGDPFDFGTSLEGEGDVDTEPQRPPGSSFFNVGFSPLELFDFETARFYAWSSLTEDGEVVAWDYAPDTSWLSVAPRDRLGCTPIACPMTGPAPGLGAREWIVNVENQSTRDAHLFVARDTGSLGELVGTAVPAAVPAGTSQRVIFTVPDGSGWAIFVNPSPSSGPLITAQDVPMDATGALPISILVQSSGAPVVSVPPAPGWFGN